MILAKKKLRLNRFHTRANYQLNVFYTLASIELIAEEIEDPFGGDTNDLPTDEIAERIKKNLNEIVGGGNA